MVAIAGNITESLAVTDWRVSAHKVKDGSLSGTTTTTGSTYSVTCADSEPCNVTIAPKIDKRWVTGTWLYLNDFIVPNNPDTTPKLYKITTAPADAEQAASSLRCHFDNNWTDESATPKTLTPSGSVALSSTWSKFGGYSAYFPGANGDYVTVSDHADLEFGSGDFIIRFWMRAISLTGAKVILYKGPVASYGSILVLHNGTSVQFGCSSTGTSWITSTLAIGTAATDTDYFVEITKVSGVFYTFLNGVAGATLASTDSLVNNTDALTIGTYGVGAVGYGFNGYIDDLEIIKGIAGHTSGYTPPTATFVGVDGATASATEPTWPSSGTVNETTTQGTVTYTYVADIDDAMFKTLGVKVPS